MVTSGLILSGILGELKVPQTFDYYSEMIVLLMPIDYDKLETL